MGDGFPGLLGTLMCPATWKPPVWKLFHSTDMIDLIIIGRW